MIALLRLLMCLDALSLGVEQIFPMSRVVLPLGGSNLAQLGILLLILLLRIEIAEYRAGARIGREEPHNSADAEDAGTRKA